MNNMRKSNEIKDKEMLVDYYSEEGRHIVITSGWSTRTGLSDDGCGRRFTRYSTEVYMNGNLIRRYDGEFSEKGDGKEEPGRSGELFEDQILLVMPLLKDAARDRIEVEELVTSIDSFLANLYEREQSDEVGNRNRFF